MPTYTTPGSPLTMTALAAWLDAAFGAAVTLNRGASAPTGTDLKEGMLWWDTSGGATAEVLKRYTVAGGWISLMTVNITAGTIVGLSALLDEDTMASDSAVLPPSQQSVKAYVDANAIFANVRQTVLSSVLTSGLPSFISAGSGLAVNIAATSVPVRISFANGFDASGPSEKIGSIVADTSITSLSANATNFLYAERDASTGAITLGKTTVEPVYSYVAPVHGAGQYWFSIPEMKMYLSNGSDTWTAKQVVFLGEAITSGDQVTSVINYALRGMYDSDKFAVAASTTYSKSDNIGCMNKIVQRCYMSGSIEIWDELIYMNAGAEYGDRIMNYDRNTTRLQILGTESRFTYDGYAKVRVRRSF